MNFFGNLMTTGMGILPHEDLDKALELSLRLDVPFWPQLPRLDFHEDMYAQFSENFPGMRIDIENKRITFDKSLFYEEYPAFYERADDESLYEISPEFSRTFHAFLARDLGRYRAVRGQVIGPVSFGLKITDQDKKPIIYDSEVREILFDFIRRKINRQARLLREKNPNAFMFLDEPGLEMLFNSISGYTDAMARRDLDATLKALEGARGVHLCGNPDWDFLLRLDIDILSFDAFHRGEIFIKYVDGIKSFLARGAIIAWGLVPSVYDDFKDETAAKAVDRLEFLWDSLEKRGITRETLAPRGMIMPATCCLINLDGAETVERSYDVLIKVSDILKSRYKALMK